MSEQLPEVDNVVDENDVETEETVDETATETKTAKPKAEPVRVSVPDGYLTPIQFKNELVKRGLVPEDFRPQMAYAWVKSPGKVNPFPVKWTDGENIYEAKAEADQGAPEGKEGRPVVELEAGLAWFEERARLQAEKASKPKVEKATKTSNKKTATDEVIEVDEAELGEFADAQ